MWSSCIETVSYTHLEWLTGLSEDKEYDSRTLCARDMEEHIKKYLDTVSSVVKGEPHQQLLTTFLGKMIDLYTVMAYHFADATAEVDRVAEDEGCLLYTSRCV